LKGEKNINLLRRFSNTATSPSREDISRNPFSGLGKPEPLKYKYKGFRSRRIDEEHRLIYQVKDDEILIAKCRFHYD
jgi:toxin YoeB